MRIMFMFFLILSTLVVIGDDAIDKTIQPVFPYQPELSGIPQKILSDSKYNFSFTFMKPRYRQDEMMEPLRDTVSQMDKYKGVAKKILNNDNFLPNEAFTINLPFWGVVYANLPAIAKDTKIINNEDNVYMLALMFARWQDKAIETGRKIQQNNPDDFGSKFLLGILAPYEKKLFQYLEQAFEMNPGKSFLLIDWHIKCLPVAVDAKHKWDFVDAYIKLLVKHRNTLRDANKIYFNSAAKHLMIIKDKYASDSYCNDPELLELKHILQNIVNDTVPPPNPLANAIKVLNQELRDYLKFNSKWPDSPSELRAWQNENKIKSRFEVVQIESVRFSFEGNDDNFLKVTFMLRENKREFIIGLRK